MESKVPVFISIAIIFLPLLLFSGNTDLYIIVSFIILLVISVESVLFLISSKKNKMLLMESEKLKSEFEEMASLNIEKLELGFKAAKSIFILSFVVLVLFVVSSNLIISIFSVLVLLLSVIELKNFKNKNIHYISFFSGILNLIYLSTIAIIKYMN